MTTRTDIHRPSEIKPEDYEFISVVVPPDADVYEGLQSEFEYFRRHLNETGGKFSTHEHGGTCHVCGASATYLAIFYHAQTNSYIQVGHTCADKFEHNPDAFKSIKARAAHYREAKAGKAKAQGILNESDLSKAWDIYLENEGNWNIDGYEENTIFNIVSKLAKYGNISEKQIEFVKKLLYQIEHRSEIAEQRKLEHEAAAECPNGRVVIEGTILSVKVQSSVYGDMTKALVQAKEGFKVWGTFVFGSAKRGDVVKFKATVAPSPDDNKFGFFKRPVVV